MAECKNCESFVTAEFVRVFGDDEGKVYGCPRCTTIEELITGDVSNPDP